MSRGEHQPEDQVVVIGAGVAGLTAANRLMREGLQVTVVEARDRTGGRIRDEQRRGWPSRIALGAEFVHGGNALLATALRTADLHSEPVAGRHWVVRHGTRRREDGVWERIDRVMQRIGPKYRGSFGRWLKRHGSGLSPQDRLLAVSFVEGFQGAPIGQMSAPALFEATKQAETQRRPIEGYGALIEGLEKNLREGNARLVLRSPVNSIVWKPSEVVITSERGRRWRARAALVTVPLGVLKAADDGGPGAIRFMPGLAAKARCWRKLESGHAVRLVLRMRADLWTRSILPVDMRERDGRGFGFIHSDELYFPTWWTAAPAPILIGWTGGPAAKAMAGWTNSRIMAAGCRTLAIVLGCPAARVRRAVLDWRTHNWAADSLARGAYSFATAGFENAPRIFARPVGQTLFFAGEATADPLELGTVHGALASGERAAREILDAWPSR